MFSGCFFLDVVLVVKVSLSTEDLQFIIVGSCVGRLLAYGGTAYSRALSGLDEWNWELG